MPIFVLKVRNHDKLRRATEKRDGGGYSPWGDVGGFTIVAASAEEARKIAAEKAGSWWLHNKWTSCEWIRDDAHSRIVLADTPTG